VIAAAIADPAVEFASNAGWFGHAHFTDRSNLDVVPALLVGVAVLALYLVAKARELITDRAPSRGVVGLLPSIFALQILTLFVMETSEQLIGYGHLLGPTIWLGGPLPVSLAVHAVVCIAVGYAMARSMRSLAVTTLRVIRLIRAIATFAVHGAAVLATRSFGVVRFQELLRALRAVGERAPPLIAG
jgi:hypothetical protein